MQRSSGKSGVQRPDRDTVSRAQKARRGTGELNEEAFRSHPREALALGHGWEGVMLSEITSWLQLWKLGK